jgi:hypothetical protein
MEEASGMPSLRMGVAVGVVAGLAWFAPAAAQAQVTADWQMNERPGSTRMIDSSGHRIHANIGSDVVLHRSTPTGWGYRFQGDGRIVDNERLVTVPDDDRLDPRNRPYVVTIRLKTGANGPNVIQKGQANHRGGYWKLTVEKGWPRCHFEDRTGARLATGFVNDPRPRTKVADGQWHTLRCARTATGVRLTVDLGKATAITRFRRGTIGSINNTWPLSLGGKVACNGRTVGCDYLNGAVDWVRIGSSGR